MTTYLEPMRHRRFPPFPGIFPERHYGDPPVDLGLRSLDWDEYQRYLYMPVKMADSPEVCLPPALGFLAALVDEVCTREASRMDDHYVYVTTHRGFATPENPLNRPGWHTDGFGTDDVNYIWTDRYPTEFAIQRFEAISDDHVRSIEQFGEQVDVDDVMTYPACTFLRLDPFVVHAAPQVPPPGGTRSFLKISLSPDRYNLVGNSHNFEFDYDWRMWTREEIRNDPAYAGGDAGPQ